MIFPKLIINDKNWQHLCAAFNKDKLSHALLFYGPEGTGKEGHAINLAALLNCENLKNKGPCGYCS